MLIVTQWLVATILGSTGLYLTLLGRGVGEGISRWSLPLYVEWMGLKLLLSHRANSGREKLIVK